MKKLSLLVALSLFTLGTATVVKASEADMQPEVSVEEVPVEVGTEAEVVTEEEVSAEAEVVTEAEIGAEAEAGTEAEIGAEEVVEDVEETAVEGVEATPVEFTEETAEDVEVIDIQGGGGAPETTAE